MNLIKKYLEDTGLTQAQFAELIGAKQGHVSLWVNGKLKVAPHWVLPIEKATDGKLSRHDLRSDIYPREHAAA